MAAFAIPLIESAVAALGGWLLRAVAVLAGAGVAQMAGEEKDDTRARTSARDLTRGGRPCKDCPPRAGWRAPTKHSMTRAARFYQWRVTGWPYDEVKWKWSEEWQWRGKAGKRRRVRSLSMRRKANVFAGPCEIPRP